MNILELKDVGVRYGVVRALDGVSFGVQAGSITGLIGPNGAGKTTLIDSLTGMTSYTGSIRFEGKPIDSWSAHQRSRAGIVRTFQSVELFRDLTVAENLLVYADARGLRDFLGRFRTSSTLDKRIDEVLELFGVGWTKDRFPDDLPHGTQRIISIARALIARPKVLLLDEPAAGLEVGETRELASQLRRVVRETDTTIFLIDHDMDLVLGHCDQIHVISFGQWVASGTPDQIRDQPEVHAAYLGIPAEAEAEAEENVRDSA
ncbi:ABC transporter ATP-binding protein [Intrasporangium sp.]|uniref:ABC transporter ATP-binding protein n=1 Tax=Intrasporangium sp. TaxID=1925024 RepID=UPI0033659C02